MSHGSTHRFPAEHHTAELARLMAIPAVAERMAQRPSTSITHDVPDLAGYSTDGDTIYIDKDFAKSGARGLFQPLFEHEHVEKTLIDVLGYSYAAAHEMATAAEHKLVRDKGLDPAAYEKELAPFIKRTEHEKITNPPKDLDCHPYYEHPDAQDLKILARLAELGVVDAQHPRQKISHAAAGYGPGHAPEFCKGCKHYMADRVRCHLVTDPVSPDGWCKLWTPKK